MKGLPEKVALFYWLCMPLNDRLIDELRSGPDVPDTAPSRGNIDLVGPDLSGKAAFQTTMMWRMYRPIPE
ncbi:hypothetical protein AO242_17715 [Pseudomonas sp. ICMP 561]|nr:hypothetical protein AO242_17715 [Pseudomonas sp. ICMP 561]